MGSRIVDCCIIVIRLGLALRFFVACHPICCRRYYAIVRREPWFSRSLVYGLPTDRMTLVFPRIRLARRWGGRIGNGVNVKKSSNEDREGVAQSVEQRTFNP